MNNISENNKKNITVKISLYSAIAFFAMMIFAKAFGLNNGDRLYYILAAVSSVCWIACMALGKYNWNQFILSAILIGVGGITTLISHKPGFVMTMMAVVAIRNLDIKKISRLYLYVWAAGFALSITLCLLGLREDIQTVNYRNDIRHSMGYVHANIFHATFLILIALYCYVRKNKLRIVDTVSMIILDIIVFLVSGSRAGLLVGVGIPILLWFYSREHKEIINRISIYSFCIIMGITLLLSFSLPLILGFDYWFGTWYETTVSRLYLSYKAMDGIPVTAFGVLSFEEMIDNAFVYIFYQYGIVPFLATIGLYVTAIVSTIRQKKMFELCLITIFVAYGFMEQLFNSAFMNFTWLIVGNEVMNVVLVKAEERQRGQETDKTDIDINRRH